MRIHVINRVYESPQKVADLIKALKAVAPDTYKFIVYNQTPDDFNLDMNNTVVRPLHSSGMESEAYLRFLIDDYYDYKADDIVFTRADATSYGEINPAIRKPCGHEVLSIIKGQPTVGRDTTDLMKCKPDSDNYSIKCIWMQLFDCDPPETMDQWIGTSFIVPASFVRSNNIHIYMNMKFIVDEPIVAQAYRMIWKYIFDKEYTKQSKYQ